MDKFQKTLLSVALGAAVGLSATTSIARDGSVHAIVIAEVAPSLTFMTTMTSGATAAGVNGQPGEGDNAVLDDLDDLLGLDADDVNYDVSGGVERIGSPFMYLEERTATLTWDLKSSTQEFFLVCDAYDLYKGGNESGQWKIDAIKVELFSSFAWEVPKPSEPSDAGAIIVESEKIGYSSGTRMYSGDTPDPVELMGPTGCVVTYKQLDPKLPAGEYWGKVELFAMNPGM